MSAIDKWINRYLLAGRGSIADGAPTNEVVVDANGAMSVAVTGSTLTDVQALPTRQTTSNVSGAAGSTPPTDVQQLGGKDPATILLRALITAAADNQGAFNILEVVSAGINGSGFADRWRNNTEGTLLANAARTANPPNADQTNFNSNSVAITIDVTAIVSTPSITVAIEVKDVASGKYVPVLTSAAITAVGTIRLRVAPSLAVAANLVANDIVGRTWRVTVTHANANSITYSVGYQLNV